MMKNKSHTTIIYARLHSIHYNSHRLAEILHCLRVQELGLSLFFLAQHFFWELNLVLNCHKWAKILADVHCFELLSVPVLPKHEFPLSPCQLNYLQTVVFLKIPDKLPNT